VNRRTAEVVGQGKSETRGIQDEDELSNEEKEEESRFDLRVRKNRSDGKGGWRNRKGNLWMAGETSVFNQRFVPRGG
jgi:hypothetical protein